MDGEKIPEKTGLEPEQEAGLDALLVELEAEETPAGEPKASGGPEISTGEMCSGVLSIAFGLYASRCGAHWALLPEESEQLGMAVGPVFDKYVPAAEPGPEYGLIMAIIMIIAPRVMTDRALIEQGAASGNPSATSITQ